MKLDNFKNQHELILQGIDTLRQCVKAGIAANAERIASEIVTLSSTIKLHLAVEDRALYPALQTQNHPGLAAMGRAYQEEMKDIAAAYSAFSRRWNTAVQVAREPERFRSDANTVLKRVYQRMHKENTEFYPAIEAS